MGRLHCSVGGATRTFEGGFGSEVATALDLAYGADGEWESAEARPFGDLDPEVWDELRDRAAEALGVDEIPNLSALGGEGRIAFLPSNVCAMTLALSAGTLRCASLTGLRSELIELAERWGLPVDDSALEEILRESEEDDGSVVPAPEVLGFAKLAMAANEAVRRGCPLWLVG